MKNFKIYNQKYPLTPKAPDRIDCFAVQGEVVYDEPEEGKFVGYTVLEDGSNVACYHVSNRVPLLIVSIVLTLCLCVFLGYLLYAQEMNVAVGDTILKIRQSNDVVVFNGMPSIDPETSTVNLQFVNGDVEATVTLSGEGITSEPVTLEPGETLFDYPVSVDTEQSVVEALLTIETASDKATYEILVEIPENMNYGAEGYNGYFANEVILHE